jgi:hypothetical protein
MLSPPGNGQKDPFCSANIIVYLLGIEPLGVGTKSLLKKSSIRKNNDINRKKGVKS